MGVQLTSSTMILRLKLNLMRDCELNTANDMQMPLARNTVHYVIL